MKTRVAQAGLRPAPHQSALRANAHRAPTENLLPEAGALAGVSDGNQSNPRRPALLGFGPGAIPHCGASKSLEIVTQERPAGRNCQRALVLRQASVALSAVICDGQSR